MRFQLGTLVTTLAMAAVIYMAQIWIVAVKIDRLLTPYLGVARAVPAPPKPPTAGEVALRLVIGNAGVAWLAYVVVSAVRRRLHRRQPGYCAGCGRSLLPAASRCELCGQRRLSCGTDEALFPVSRG